MQIFQFVRSNVCVVNAVFAADATISADGSTISWEGGTFAVPAGEVAMNQPGAHVGWVLVDGALTPPAADLRPVVAQAKTAAGAAADAVVAAITPDSAHQAAFQNAAAILNGLGGVAPTTGPFAAPFAALAASYGMSATGFAGLVVQTQAASLSLGAALATFNNAASAAADAPALATALAAFQSSLDGIVAALNTALPSPVPTPPTLVIAGVNG